MNERIKELIENFSIDPEHGFIIPEKFAELIVRECVSVIAKRQNQAIADGCNVDEAVSMAMMDLLESFGVEE